MKKILARIRQLKNDHRGYSLVELIVAFTILGIATVAIGGFLITGIKSYTKTNAEAQVQNEAQTALNQMENMVRAAALGVSYNVNNGSDNYVEQDSEVSGTIVAKYLYVFNWADDAQTTIKALIIKWDPSDKNMYYAEIDSISDNENVLTEASPSRISSWDFLASGVESFSCDLSAYGTTGKITMNLALKNSEREYTTSGVVTLRNNVLINAANTSELYTRRDVTVVTKIAGVTLSANSESVVKNGSVQLSTNVYSENDEGYPSQTIAKWELYWVKNYYESANPADAADSDLELIYDSNDASVTGPAAIDVTTKVLTLTSLNVGTDSVKMLKVLCYVDGVDDEGNSILISSNAVYIAVKNISNFALQPNKTKCFDAPENATLQQLENTYAAAYTDGTSFTNGEMDARPGNKLFFDAIVSGDNLSAGDQTVVWAITNVPNADGTTPAAAITGEGVLSIDRYSVGGTVLVTAYPRLNSGMTLTYQVNVADPSITGENTLKISGNKTMNRSSSQTLGLTMNGVDVSNSDFNWTAAIQEKGVTGTPVTISNGVLYVSGDLSYDYAYTILVTASLKNNARVSSSFLVSVPKVTLRMNYPVYNLVKDETTLKPEKKGYYIPEGTIYCTVTGIDSYTLNWTIASQTNSTSFGAGTLNGSYVAQGTSSNSAAVLISTTEPSKVSSFWVKATLTGHSNVYATCMIVSGDVLNTNFTLSPSTATVKRGKDATFTYTPQETISGFKNSDVIWSIVSVKEGSTDLSGQDGLSIANGKLTVASDFYPSTADVTVTIQADWAGITRTAVVTIPKEEFSVSPETATAQRGGTVTVKATATEGRTITWTLPTQAFNDGVRFTTSDGDINTKTTTGTSVTIRVPEGYKNYATTGDSFTVTASTTIGSKTLSAKSTISVGNVSLQVSGTNSGLVIGTDYMYTASMSGAVDNGITWMVDGQVVDGVTGNSFTYTPDASGNHTITAVSSLYKDSTGNALSASKKVTVLAPAVAIEGAAEGNVNAPYSCTAKVTNADAASGTLSWTLDGAVVADATGTTFSFTPSTTGTHTISVTYRLNNETATDTKTVTIREATISVSPRDASCKVNESQTYTATLTNASLANGSISWTVKDGSGQAVAFTTGTSGGKETVTFTPVSGGTYTITAVFTYTGSTTTLTDTVRLTVTARGVSISGDTTGTVGVAKTYTATTRGFSGTITYVWYVNGQAQTGSNSATFRYTPSLGGSYEIHCTASERVNGKTSTETSNSITLRVEGPQSKPEDSSLNYKKGTSGQWTTGGVSYRIEYSKATSGNATYYKLTYYAKSFGWNESVLRYTEYNGNWAKIGNTWYYWENSGWVVSDDGPSHNSYLG